MTTALASGVVAEKILEPASEKGKGLRPARMRASHDVVAPRSPSNP
jgi:hypothetical protein